jgi:hypothetical protein
MLAEFGNTRCMCISNTRCTCSIFPMIWPEAYYMYASGHSEGDEAEDWLGEPSPKPKTRLSISACDGSLEVAKRRKERAQRQRVAQGSALRQDRNWSIDFVV